MRSLSGIIGHLVTECRLARQQAKSLVPCGSRRDPSRDRSRDPRDHCPPDRGPCGHGHSAVAQPRHVYLPKATSGMTSGAGPPTTSVAGDGHTMGMDAYQSSPLDDSGWLHSYCSFF